MSHILTEEERLDRVDEKELDEELQDAIAVRRFIVAEKILEIFKVKGWKS